MCVRSNALRALALKPGEVIDISMIEQIVIRGKPFPALSGPAAALKNHLRTTAIFVTIKRITGFSCKTNHRSAALHPS